MPNLAYDRFAMVDEAFFQSHPKLVHYTSVDAFQKIFETQALWASHYATLNDKSEMTHIKHVLYDRVDIILPELNSLLKRKDLSQDDIEKEKHFLVNVLYSDPIHERTRRQHFDPYVISFCTHEHSDHDDMSYAQENGLLSQWIAYGGTAGCMVVFDTRNLYSLLREEAEEFLINPDIFPMIYVKNSNVVKELYSDFDDRLIKMCLNVYQEKNDLETVRKWLEAVINISERIKHVAFSAESEVRMSVSLFTHEDSIREHDPNSEKKPKKVCYRMKGNLLAPYVVLFGSHKRLPIERVIVGPNSEQVRIADAVQRMCEPSGIQVTLSNTPYVSSR